MAHTLYTPTQAARSVLAALRWQSTLPRTVRQDFSADFVPGIGATVNVRKPVSAGTARVYTAANRTARDPIAFNDLTETWVPVTLANQIYNAVRLPGRLRDVLVGEPSDAGVEAAGRVRRRRSGDPTRDGDGAIAGTAGTEIDLTGTNVLAVVIEARRILNSRNVPLADRTLALGSALAADFLNLAAIRAVDQSGSDGALREATIGMLFGFTVIESNDLPADQGVAYHRDAFAHVTRPSRAPEGAAKSAVVSEGGFSLRWIQHYNPIQLEDQSVVDTFYGAKTLDATRAVGITKATS
ncbi:MAG: hypothetical protein IPH38_18450 [Candidatus Microthrix sp.]|nr:hypothetical protein [Candidatus Microthrix sp.]MBK7021515.1 hypothetical protein [Candidatus Microthrix sp.]